MGRGHRDRIGTRDPALPVVVPHLSARACRGPVPARSARVAGCRWFWTEPGPRSGRASAGAHRTCWLHRRGARPGGLVAEGGGVRAARAGRGAGTARTGACRTGVLVAGGAVVHCRCGPCLPDPFFARAAAPRVEGLGP